MSSMMAAEDAVSETPVATLQDFLSRYSQLTESCFNTCVWDFRGTTLKGAEERCTERCVDKFTKVTQRVSERAQEIQFSGTFRPTT